MKIKVTLTQEFELPDSCRVIEHQYGKLIKCGNSYLSPGLEFMQSNKYSEKGMHFEELDENMRDLLFEALVIDKEDINEV